MELKDYQQQTLDTLDRYLEALNESLQQLAQLPDTLPANMRQQLADYPRSAWESLRGTSGLPSMIHRNGEYYIPDYISRTATSKEPIPHVCLKVPTGGGKTLLGVEAINHLKLSTGFVLWIVPTKAIYTQTWEAFQNKEHPYRQILNRVSSDRVKLLTKDDIFTKQDVENHLCVMLLSFHAVNQNNLEDEFLKFARDNGGYTSFFPVEDDPQAHQVLLGEHLDLDTILTEQGHLLIKKSLFNVFKLRRPVVILDEAHKTYGRRKEENNHQFVAAINRFNPRFVLELSATPKIGISNILVNVSGVDLQKEEMIKLPIELHNFPNSNWKHTLEETKKVLDKLETIAMQSQDTEGRYIRPIAVIRVDRTGKKQRDGQRVHAFDARDELIGTLGVPEEQVKIKSSERDELKGIDLLSDTCPVRYIITKDALKEGWDCSFAYLLALLDNTTASTAITQLIGRVMRQPYAQASQYSELNKCYIFCYNQEVKKAVSKVKNGLEAEGLTGLPDDAVQSVDDQSTRRETIHRRQEYQETQIYLPLVLHQQGNDYRHLNYERDILGAIPWNEIGEVEPVNLGDEADLQEVFAIIHLQDETEFDKKFQESATHNLDIGYFVRYLTDVIPNPWRASHIVKNILAAYQQQGYDNEKLYEQRLLLAQHLKYCLQERVETHAETLFQEKLANDEIRFRLETNEQLNYELAEELVVNLPAGASVLTHTHADPLEHNLFEPVYEGEFNTLEKDFALYIDKQSAIKWWHRIAVKQDYFLQGWRRHRVYPDFLVCLHQQDDNPQRFIIFETKGQQLAGNSDTDYKQNLLTTLENAYENATEHGTMSAIAPDGQSMLFRLLFENNWKPDFNRIIAED